MNDPVEDLKTTIPPESPDGQAIWGRARAAAQAGRGPALRPPGRAVKVAGLVVALAIIGAVVPIGLLLRHHQPAVPPMATPALATESPVATSALATESPSEPEPPIDPLTNVPSFDPIDLINLWRVTAPGEQADTWLRLDAGDYQLWRSCGFWEGGWRTDGQVFFAAAPTGMSGACASEDGMADFDPVPWLAAAVTAEATTDGWRLLDADGAELAALTIDGAPPPDPNSADFYRQPPEITDELRGWMAQPAPLPAGVVPATSDLLIGKWVPIENVSTEPFLEFTSDGTWHGTDGCNGIGGEWRLIGDQGALFAFSGGTTAIGCGTGPL
ncbi:MAG: META domain-containing protein, partial [Micrococcales bacterium]|nr:META domain-containing protein [Micrococcales bacterium]